MSPYIPQLVPTRRPLVFWLVSAGTVLGLVSLILVAPIAAAGGHNGLAFAIYRAASAINALFEHANFRAPLWLDRSLSLVTTWPYLHKVHHSRLPEQTDTNYGNLFSFWDRLFGTFTPSDQGRSIRYGLDGYDRPELQTTTALLALPFRSAHPGNDVVREPAQPVAFVGK